VSTRRVHLRAPGVKTGSTVGPLGPFRGTLGIHWVIGAIAVGLVIVLVVTWLLFREPPAPFEPVDDLTFEQLEIGTPTEVLAGIYVARTAEDRAFAIAEPANCELEILPDGYLDCADRKFGLDGVGHKSSLVRLPIEIHRGTIYIDTSSVG
jgi:hypothetical protein